MIKQNEILSSKYDVLVMNPPYMTSSSMNDVLKKFVNKEYPRSKSDMFATFMELDHLLNDNALYAVINMHSWMFLSSFEKLRKHIVLSKQIDSMLHLGTRAFEEIGGEVVQTTAFILRNYLVSGLEGIYFRLVDYNNSNVKSRKLLEAVNNTEDDNRFIFNQLNYNRIPGHPIAYWITDKFALLFENDSIKKHAEVITGMTIGNNNKYLRLWFEIADYKADLRKTDFKDGEKYWLPYTKGGGRRNWYGNFEYVVNWNEKNNFNRSKTTLSHLYFKEGITWPFVAGDSFAVRYLPKGFLWDVAGSPAFINDQNNFNYIFGFLNSKPANYILKVINPTINIQSNDINNLPIIYDDKEKNVIDEIVIQNVKLSNKDWDSYETSWDFKKIPLIKFKEEVPLIGENLNNWVKVTDERFKKLKVNEEELNRIFIDIYGLQAELTPEVSPRDITITKIYDEPKDIPEEIKGNQYVLTKKDVIQQFISYAVGCMFGRYSLDEEGLVYAGGEFDASRYETYRAVEDNIIPITSDVYLEDDLVDRFVKFVETVYGKETLEENLNFIAEALGQKKNETSRDTIHSYFLKDFFKDHAKMYSVIGSGRRPIYWKFSSGKENAFNCFIYMHRYDKTTISRIRTEYLHDVQQRLEIRKVDLDQILNSDASTTELNKARKEMKTVEKQLAELIAYDEKLRHMADQQIEIDLDDGFKANYPKFKGLVEKV